jgi:probable rRNA maturation factor
VVLTDNRTSRRLNRTWRGKDKPTNVLSFPAGGEAGPRDAPRLLGDVVLAGGVVAAEAEAQGKRLSAHLTHLVVHGVLHLLGHDHERDRDAERMEALEIRILRRLGVANPYEERR